MGLFASAVIAASCAVEPAPVTVPPWVEAIMEAEKEPTPEIWRSPGKWTFDIHGPEGEDLGLISLEFTDEPVESCVATDSLGARLIESTTSIAPLDLWYGNEHGLAGPTYPAYNIIGSTLYLTLNASICDANLNLAGLLSENGGEGAVRGEGLAYFEEIGTFEVRRYEEPE